jgi:hypothetical protein
MVKSMTALHTRLIPRPLVPERSHEHAWLIESRHSTSGGFVLYVRCAGCAARRVDLQPHPLSPPEALSRQIE